jgi:hypothetical protein
MTALRGEFECPLCGKRYSNYSSFIHHSQKCEEIKRLLEEEHKKVKQ